METNNKTESSLKGFRLNYLELFNWGTFRGLQTIYPAGYSSLLTGANGSGKTTLVDSVITLLVPNVSRNYNLASGAARKRERNERSYVLGAFGERRDESQSEKTIVQYLRKTKNTHSVLIARFDDLDTKKGASLAQFFWFENENLKKFFIVSEKELHYKIHFRDFHNVKDLKQRLKNNQGIETYPQFNAYSKRFRKLLSLKSENALDLFNETVSLKEIRSLDGFVRDHMLAKSSHREHVSHLHQSYENLTEAYESIKRDRQKLEILEPLVSDADDYEEVLSEKKNIEYCKEGVPGYLADKQIQLLDKKLEHLHQEFTRKNEQSVSLTNEIASLEDRKLSLENQLANNKTGQRLNEIRRDIKELEKEGDWKRKTYDNYVEVAKRLGLPSDPSRDQFHLNGQKVLRTTESTKIEYTKLIDGRDDLKIRQNNLEKDISIQSIELKSLKLRKSQIPEINLKNRKKILDALDLNEDDLPFVGELIQVLDSELEWEGALERLLHGFALCLLVPNKLYKRVNRFVDQTDLGGRIVYFRIANSSIENTFVNVQLESVCNKLEIKSNPFANWIENELVKRFNYICCEDLDQFSIEVKAITRNGLIKGGNSRHEKDDRRKIGDRRYFVLGWDNKEKIRSIENELLQLNETLVSLQHQIKEVDSKIETNRIKQEDLQSFQRFRDFDEIDYKTVATLIAELQEEHDTLLSASEEIKELERSKKKIIVAIDAKKAENERLLKSIGGVETTIKDSESKIDQCNQILAAYPSREFEAISAQIELYLPKRPRLTLEEFTVVGSRLSQNIEKELTKKENERSSVQTSLTNRMQDFNKKFEEDAIEVQPRIVFIPSYRDFHQQVLDEDLPKHEKRFKELLNDEVVNQIIRFADDLEEQERFIRERIRELNCALGSIKYTESTFIKLKPDRNKDTQIADFRKQLQQCIPDPVKNQEDENERCFHNIRQLIEKLNENEIWRDKVADVRQWLNFTASECYVEEPDRVKQDYKGTSSKSGGQKVKLAYTILASAIAYQFGLNKEGRTAAQSFRFVVIDEVFSKSDSINSEYAMKLFQELGIQLMVVSPLDKTRIVEPYISTIHLVTNTDEENDSKVYEMTINEFQEQCAELKETA